MKNGERIFYFVLLCILAAFTVFLLFKMKQVKSMYNLVPKGEVVNNRLFSFNGTQNSGASRFFHFTAYSGEYYLFAVVSNECGHCPAFIENLQRDIDHHQLDKEIGVHFLSADDIDGTGKGEQWDNRFFKVNNEDIFQFGISKPSLVLTNGRGDVLFRGRGYKENMVPMILDIYKKNRFRKSEKL